MNVVTRDGSSLATLAATLLRESKSIVLTTRKSKYRSAKTDGQLKQLHRHRKSRPSFSLISPHIRSGRRRREPPKAENPIDHVRGRTSGIRDFSTPHGV